MDLNLMELLAINKYVDSKSKRQKAKGKRRKQTKTKKPCPFDRSTLYPRPRCHNNTDKS